MSAVAPNILHGTKIYVEHSVSRGETRERNADFALACSMKNRHGVSSSRGSILS